MQRGYQGSEGDRQSRGSIPPLPLSAFDIMSRANRYRPGSSLSGSVSPVGQYSPSVPPDPKLQQQAAPRGVRGPISPNLPYLRYPLFDPVTGRFEEKWAPVGLSRSEVVTGTGDKRRRRGAVVVPIRAGRAGAETAESPGPPKPRRTAPLSYKAPRPKTRRRSSMSKLVDSVRKSFSKTFNFGKRSFSVSHDRRDNMNERVQPKRRETDDFTVRGRKPYQDKYPPNERVQPTRLENDDLTVRGRKPSHQGKYPPNERKSKFRELFEDAPPPPPPKNPGYGPNRSSSVGPGISWSGSPPPTFRQNPAPVRVQSRPQPQSVGPSPQHHPRPVGSRVQSRPQSSDNRQTVRPSPHIYPKLVPSRVQSRPQSSNHRQTMRPSPHFHPKPVPVSAQSQPRYEAGKQSMSQSPHYRQRPVPLATRSNTRFEHDKQSLSAAPIHQKPLPVIAVSKPQVRFEERPTVNLPPRFRRESEPVAAQSQPQFEFDNGSPSVNLPPHLRRNPEPLAAQSQPRSNSSGQNVTPSPRIRRIRAGSQLHYRYVSRHT